jgi:hypothetical protein
MDVLGLAPDELYEHEDDESEGDAGSYAVGERHHGDSDERDCRVLEVVPVDVSHSGYHKHTDDYKYRGRRAGRNDTDYRGKHKAQREENSGSDRGKTGAAARGDTGRALDISRGVGSSEESARDGGAEVGAQGTVKTGFDALAGIEELFVGLIEYAGTTAGSDKGSDSVEDIGKYEADDGGDCAGTALEVSAKRPDEIHLHRRLRDSAAMEEPIELQEMDIVPRNAPRLVTSLPTDG